MTTDEDERAIRELVDTWMAASKAGDLKIVLGLMTDDVIFMTPGQEPFGKEEFGANSEAMADLKMDGRAEIRELQVLGSWAWIRNHIEVAITPPGGETVRRLYAQHPAQRLRRTLAIGARRKPGDVTSTRG